MSVTHYRQIVKSTHSGATSEVKEDIHLAEWIHRVFFESDSRACLEMDEDNFEKRRFDKDPSYRLHHRPSEQPGADETLAPVGQQVTICPHQWDQVHLRKKGWTNCVHLIYGTVLCISPHCSHGYCTLGARSRGFRERALEQESL